MKRNYLLIILLCLSADFVFAQEDTVKLKDLSRHKTRLVTDRPPQAVYFLLGGSGPLLSANYDRRFGKRVNGLGFSGGVGYYGAIGINIVSFPVSINYLFGHQTHFFEAGTGATFLTANVGGIFDNAHHSVVFYHLSLGYRHQPTRGGFFFRGGITPLFFNGGTFTSYYLGFGYNF